MGTLQRPEPLSRRFAVNKAVVLAVNWMFMAAVNATGLSPLAWNKPFSGLICPQPQFEKSQFFKLWQL